jgi:hypothetical protein
MVRHKAKELPITMMDLFIAVILRMVRQRVEGYIFSRMVHFMMEDLKNQNSMVMVLYIIWELK